MILIKFILHKNVLVTKYYKSYFKILSEYVFYLKPTEACQTKANSKKKIGIAGKISIIGLKTTYASGSLETRIVIII
jgi:hypothetical protein